MKLRMLTAVLLATVAALLVTAPASAAPGDLTTPNVTGPIAADANSYPFLATDADLAKYGYVEEEFFIEGDAYRHDFSVGTLNDPAAPILTLGANSDGLFPYKTRIVVRRPANPANANGTVVAEWNNVTATQDIEWNWFGDPIFMLKNGYTFVGVTAQNTGVNSLLAFDPVRYAGLTVNGNNTVPTGPGIDADALSYDVFSSAIKAVTGGGTGVDPLPGMNPDTVIASGESQSCGRLANHHNRIEPLHEMLDAYLLTVCGSSLRTDRPEKVVRILSETENRTERTTTNFPDTGSIRHWEVAGGSHLPRMSFDNFNNVFTRDGPLGPPVAECTKFPLSLVPWPFTQNRAIDALVKWVENNELPPIAPRGEYIPNPTYNPMLPISGSNPLNVLKRDADGIAFGGIRYPELTVPVGVNDGINSTGGPSLFSLFCGLLGSTTQFDESKLHTLYVDFADYVDKYAAAADAMLPQGFVLAEDVERMKERSRQFADLRPTAPQVVGPQANKGSFDLTWRGTEAPDTQFQLQRAKSVGTPVWADVNATEVVNKATLANEPEGTHRYRLRTTTIVPGTNISPARTAITPYSEELVGVKVDRSGPRAPRVIVKGKAFRKAGKKVKGTYRGKVTVRFTGRPDAKLRDGSAGVGLNNRSVPKTRVIRKKGRTVIKVQTRDKLGNRSKPARVVITIR